MVVDCWLGDRREPTRSSQSTTSPQRCNACLFRDSPLMQIASLLSVRHSRNSTKAPTEYGQRDKLSPLIANTRTRTRRYTVKSPSFQSRPEGSNVGQDQQYGTLSRERTGLKDPHTLPLPEPHCLNCRRRHSPERSRRRPQAHLPVPQGHLQQVIRRHPLCSVHLPWSV